MADYATMFTFILVSLTFVIVGMVFIVYLMILGERQKKRLKATGLRETGEAEKSFECQHAFGYLSEFPVNQPVPDECFGCKRALECMNANVSEEEVETVEAQP